MIAMMLLVRSRWLSTMGTRGLLTQSRIIEWSIGHVGLCRLVLAHLVGDLYQ